uniref:Cystatin kininogen-type domain-containing protein n=1 Tax=Bos indicus x Bos taurus TaxID=30522 RepID=A0A4W2ERV2_BOBOX
MKLITILFLCSRLLPSLTQESSQEIDCNDQDVFKAVDAALTKYNSENKSGNQFVLYRITEVARMATGECTATVAKRGNMKFSVAIQTCLITPAEGPVVTAQYECLGCVHPISTKSPDLEPVLRYAIQYFNNNTSHSHLFDLKEVKRAQRQVVSGWNYEVNYSIAQTNCSKEEFSFLTPDCKSLSSGDTGECTDKAHVDVKLRISSFSQKCDLYPVKDFVQPPTRLCAGCPKPIPVDSPDLEEPLSHSIAKLNAEHDGAFYFKIDTVKKATVQVVAGLKYSIVFIARETTCSKGSNEELTKSCEINIHGQILHCDANVYVVPWEEKVYPTVNCQSLGQTSLMKRPPGFSPFRSVQVMKTEGSTTVSVPHSAMSPVQDEERDSGKEQGPTHGHGWDHGKQIKLHGLGLGHKHKHDQGHGHHRSHGLGHGHQKQHGLGHGHKHGHGHGKHKNKGKNNGKHYDWRTPYLASSYEDSTTSSAQTQEKTEETTLSSLAQPGVAITFPDFQDSDLIATVMPNTLPPHTESDDDWIPDIQTEPNSLAFKLISDFPETTSPKCPSRPWKPVNGVNPTVEMKESHDFDLVDALL